ncbi:twin-arginine translocation signal domain-containing protein, partial [Comamonas thiooxydans]
MPSTSRRSFLQSSAAAGAAMLAPSVWAQSPWPSKPIRIVVPY